MRRLRPSWGGRVDGAGHAAVVVGLGWVGGWVGGWREGEGWGRRGVGSEALGGTASGECQNQNTKNGTELHNERYKLLLRTRAAQAPWVVF